MSTGHAVAATQALRAYPDRALVALDFDGTLAPIVARPADARPAAGALETLRAVAGRVGLLAVVTGRPAAEVVAVGGLAAVPGLVVLGHYGLQRWAAGLLTSPAALPAVARARAQLPGLLAGPATDPGVSIEDKEHSVAVHTRGAADPDAALEALRAPLAGLAADSGLELVAGRLVWELRPAGVDKGAALRGLLTEMGRPASTVLYAGDDVGDLPAFSVVEEARENGTPGLTVAVGGTGAPPDVARRADLVLDGPAALVAWLAQLFDD